MIVLPVSVIILNVYFHDNNFSKDLKFCCCNSASDNILVDMKWEVLQFLSKTPIRFGF